MVILMAYFVLNLIAVVELLESAVSPYVGLVEYKQISPGKISSIGGHAQWLLSYQNGMGRDAFHMECGQIFLLRG